MWLILIAATGVTVICFKIATNPLFESWAIPVRKLRGNHLSIEQVEGRQNAKNHKQPGVTHERIFSIWEIFNFSCNY